jgi:hypothetical protein
MPSVTNAGVSKTYPTRMPHWFAIITLTCERNTHMATKVSKSAGVRSFGIAVQRDEFFLVVPARDKNFIGFHLPSLHSKGFDRAWC